MPPLLAAIPAALLVAGEFAATGATFFGLTGLTAALVAGASTLALGTAVNLLAGSGKHGGANPIGDIGPSRSPFAVIPDQPRTWAYGRAATGGSIKYWQTSGVDNNMLYFAVAVHDTPCDGFESMYINNTLINFSGGGATNVYVDALGNPLMWRSDHLGAEDQLADAGLVGASGGQWTDNHRLRGMAYYVWQMQFDTKVFAQGIPTPLLVLRGRPVWDPRQDVAYGGTGTQTRADPSTWTWSQNAALCLLDYMLGVKLGGVRIGGCGVPIGRLDISSFITAANICDEDVALAGGGTEKRYTMNGFVDAMEDKNSVVQSMLQAMCGFMLYRSGQLAVIAGAAQTSVMSLNDDDLAGAININPTTSRQEKINSITSIYAEPAQLYQVVSAPPLIVPAYEIIDGGLHLETEIRHRFSTSVATCQRINKLVLSNFREQLSFDAKFKPKGLLISVGDTFLWSSAAAGYVSQKMICLERDLQEDGSIRIVARQETDAKYSWSTSEQQAPPTFSTATVFDPSSVTAPLTGDVSVTGVNLTGRDSSSVPALLLTCNAPPSPFVTSIITVYKLHTDSNWHSGPTIEPVRPPGPAYITGISPGIAYDVGFAYVTNFGVSAFTTKSSITSGSNLISTGATAGSIDTTALAAGAVTAGKFAAGIRPVNVVSSLPAGTEGDVSVLTSDGKLYRYHSGAWTVAVPTVDLTGQITNGQLAANIVDQTKVANGLVFIKVVSSLPGGASQGDTAFLTTDNKLYRYSGSAWVATVPTADLTGQITNTQITDGSISTPKLAANAVTTATLAAGAVTANEIAANTITAGQIAAAAIGTTQLAAGAVTANEIAANAITSVKISAGAVDTLQLAANSITSAKVAADAIIAGAIAAGAVNAGTIIVDDIIVTGHLVANAVTSPQVATGSTTTLSQSSGSPSLLLSITFTTDGGPVMVDFTDWFARSGGHSPSAVYYIQGPGGTVVTNSTGGSGVMANCSVAGSGLDTSVEGFPASYTWYLYAYVNGGDPACISENPFLRLTELKK